MGQLLPPLHLSDFLLTPPSSRHWPVEGLKMRSIVDRRNGFKKKAFQEILFPILELVSEKEEPRYH